MNFGIDWREDDDGIEGGPPAMSWQLICDHGSDRERRVWVVSAGTEWTTPACCQLEAWDRVVLKEDVGSYGLIVTAREADKDEESTIAIHTAGLMLRYGRPDLAAYLDEAAERTGLNSISHLYRNRKDWTRGGAFYGEAAK